MNESVFPDQPHIDRIREALWFRRPYGNAAVLVGAGLSLNAKPLTPGDVRFPSWRELTEKIVDRLYPPTSTGSERYREAARDQTKATSGALRLAQEYEAAFGRNALDLLIASSIPDARFGPGPLHELLLELPWTDVFTTNWDTLLERAADRLLERRYDVVRTMEEIPRSLKPRIVKLHGSLPSNAPFILTEEDFRTYQAKFAPFVNMAQQAMMENVFCLLGFSGDDPNFLYWSGWVRDQLGRSAPKIYLVGWLDLSSTQRKVLEDNNVVPVDLARLPGSDRWPEALRHREALHWFLENLRAAEPYNEVQWPRRRRAVRVQKPDFWPPIPASSAPEPREEHAGPQQEGALGAVLNEADVWRHNRLLYPGWIVAPESVRQWIWLRTRRWIPEALKVLEQASLEQRFTILGELNWRLELCLVPLSAEIAGAIDGVLRAVDPMAWEAREAWTGLAVSRLRYARESDSLEDFEEWARRLQAVLVEHPWLRSRIHYERCLLALSRLDHEAIKRVLARWDTSEDEPFWEVRKSAILAEIGKTEDAYLLSFGALEKIQRQTRKDRTDIVSFSREGWAMVLYSGFGYFRYSKAREREEGESQESGGGFFQALYDRWEWLAVFKCNAWGDLQDLQHLLLGEIPRPRPRVSETREFDRESRTITYREGGEDNRSLLLPALQAKRLAEEAGVPPAAGGMSLAGTMLARAAVWLREEMPDAALALLLRVCDSEDDDIFREFFPRHQIALLSRERAADLFARIERSLDDAVPEIENAGADMDRRLYWLGRVRVAIELLSRLVLRLEGNEAERALARAVSYYKNPVFQAESWLTQPLTHLFGRSLEALEPKQRRAHLYTLAALPVPGMERFEPSAAWWPDPLSELSRAGLTEPTREPPEGWSRTIAALIEGAQGRPYARKKAVSHLRRLHRWGLLNDEEQRDFGRALWNYEFFSRGSPRDTGLAEWAFLALPETEPGRAEVAFRVSYLSATGPHYRSSLDSRYLENLFGAVRMGGLRLSEEESILVLEKVLSWWRDQGQRFTVRLGERERAESRSLESALVRGLTVLLPRIPVGDSRSAALGEMLDGMSRWGFAFEAIYPYLARITPDLTDELVRRLRQSLASLDKKHAPAAVEAVLVWLREGERLQIGPPPADLPREIAVAISTRRPSNLRSALEAAEWIVANAPAIAEPIFMRSVEEGLEYLLNELQYGREQGGPGTISPEEVPELRAGCVRLAGAMAEAGQRSEPINRWLEEAREDPLPEVRQALTAQRETSSSASSSSGEGR